MALFLPSWTQASQQDEKVSTSNSREEESGWPQWRGPSNNGVSLAKKVPTKWSSTENVVWRTELPGPAGSTPVIAGNKIFLTSVDKDGRVWLMAFNKDGDLAWKEKLADKNRNVRVDEGNTASPSPCTDGKHVYSMLADGTLACFEVDGQSVWKKDLQSEYGRFSIQFGLTSTPVLDRGVLYLQLVHGEMRDRSTDSVGWIVALNAKDGKEIWKHKRETDGRGECKHAYTSPIMYRDDAREFLLIHGADYITAHQLKDGSEIWRCGGFQRDRYNLYLRFVASPVCVPGMIVVPSAKDGPVLALKPDLKGDVTEDENARIWRMDRQTPDVPSTLIHDGLVYLCRENGILLCVDAKTGEQLYRERTVSGRHRSSPVYANGHIYLTARDGTVTVVKAGREFEIVEQNSTGEQTSSSLAISDGRIYLRTFNALYAIGEK